MDVSNLKERDREGSAPERLEALARRFFGLRIPPIQYPRGFVLPPRRNFAQPIGKLWAHLRQSNHVAVIHIIVGLTPLPGRPRSLVGHAEPHPFRSE